MPVTEEQFIKMAPEERQKTINKMELERDFSQLPVEDREKINELLEVQEKDPMSQIEAGARGAAQGLTFGFADEIAAGLSAAGKSFLGKESFQPALDRALKEHRTRDKLAAEKFPKTFGGTELAGAVGVSLIPVAGQAVRGAAMGKGVLSGILGAGKAAVGGAATELGKAEDKSQANITRGALTGGTVGAGASLLGPVGRFATKTAIRTPRVVSAFVSGGKSEVFRAGAEKALKFLPQDLAKTEKLSSLKKVFDQKLNKVGRGAEVFVDTLGEAFEKQGAAGLVTAHAQLLEDPKYIEFLDRVESLKGK